MIVVYCEEHARGSYVVQALAAAGHLVRWVTGVEAAFALAGRGGGTVLVADARDDDVASWLVAGWRRRTGGAGRVVLLVRSGSGEPAEIADEVVSSPLSTDAIRTAVGRVMREEKRA